MIKDRIKELREKNNLTKADFAKSAGISPTSVSLYESGRQNPRKKTIKKICEVYGVDEDWLTSTTPNTSNKAVKDTPTTPAVDIATSKPAEDAVNKPTEDAANKPTEDAVNESVTDTPAKPVENKPEKNAEKTSKNAIDIPSILARVAEIGVRKAAAEAGVAWQTVNKWKKDAEKAAAALPSSEDIGKSAEEIVEAAGEISDGIQKTLDNLTTLEGAQEAVTKVMKMVTPETEENETTAPAEEERKEQKEIDISAVLNRVAEIGVRKAAAEIGVAWQTVNKWKKDAAATQTAPITSTAQTKEEKKAEQKVEKKEGVVVAAEVIEKKTKIIIQSPLGGNITPRQVLQKIPAGTDSVYIRVDENKLYWVKGDENGAVDIWG